jgi:hypothetical protein
MTASATTAGATTVERNRGFIPATIPFVPPE